ncbi:MAG: aminopeptidase [Clostridiales bacterium]|nr:aminopeptidase [Clostridiales bacterium]
MSALSYKRTNVYEKADEKLLKDIFDYAEGYKVFLDEGKTEREACAFAKAIAIEKGYKPFKFGQKLKAGDKVYYDNRGKNLYLLKIGEEDVAENGIRILASHIDSPRIDFKQVPLYESDGIAFAKTHYYGGIRKYQWAAVPLALHGAVALKDGSVINVKVGEDENDPVFYISDLLPHLAAKQNAKPLGEGIGGEDLNIWLGNIPYTAASDEKDKTVKENLLKILNDKYGMAEEDFLSAELCVVPAFKAKDIGFDRALLGAYGHDDRVCSYPAFTALFDAEDSKHTVMVILADKEEIGSEGTTGMQCALFADLIDEIARSFDTTSAAIRANSKCLSADVNAGYDPNFPDVCEKLNSAYVSCGAGITKFTGSRGKGGSNDADAEFIGYLRKLFDDNGVIWQTGEMGKVDVGGGGTVAKYIANMNIDTIDIGVPVISMHSPFELVSKADVYEVYLAFKAFVK